MRRIYVVGVLALTLGLAGCGGGSSSSAPDLEATRQACYANERAVVAAAARASQAGKAIAADWNGVMNVVVPSYLEAIPTCPGGGTYSLTLVGGRVDVICSLHGSADDPATRK